MYIKTSSYDTFYVRCYVVEVAIHFFGMSEVNDAPTENIPLQF